MFLEVIVFGLVVAWIRGGRLKTDVDIRYMWLAPVAYAIQMVNMYLLPTSSWNILFTAISYSMLAVLAWANAERPGLRIMVVGLILNGLVMAVNGGRIPVDIEASKAVGINADELLNGVMAKHAALTPDSRLPFLGDVIRIPFPIPRLISVGDVFAAIGAVLLIQELMGKPLRLWSERSGEKPAKSLRGDIG